jgi:ubiquinone/menaquinone biosynthesis C-methylase UbiE
MIKKYLTWLYAKSADLNDDNVCKALFETGPHKILLDVGCWDGVKTLMLAQSAKSEQIYGIEPVQFAAKEAEKRNIKVYQVKADADKWPLKDNSVDCIVSNQVIEHLTDVDFFLSESSRVLKKGGFMITSTNNLSSWHNIISLVFGWAPFDLTNSSKLTKGVGNPLAIHRGETDERGTTWTHKCIYTTRWLNEWQQLYGLIPRRVLGAGYHPLLPQLGMIFTKHCAFITVIAQKGSHK